MRAERAFIIPSAEGPLCVYALECDDYAYAIQMFAQSKLPIDHEHAAVMAACLGDAVEWEQLDAMALSDR